MSVRDAVKAILRPLGLLGLVRNLDPRRPEFGFRKLDRWEGEVAGVPLRFSTEDNYSKGWFFPRYANDRIHERGVAELLAEKLAGAKCFVDVGTNLGWLTCLAGKLMPSGVVHGFEMDDLNFALAQRNVEMNGLGNVHLYRSAAAEVTPVREVDRRQIGEGRRGPVTAALQAAFFDVVAGRESKYDRWLTFV